jgi:hypothetical protein
LSVSISPASPWCAPTPWLAQHLGLYLYDASQQGHPVITLYYNCTFVIFSYCINIVAYSIGTITTTTLSFSCSWDTHAFLAWSNHLLASLVLFSALPLR